MSLIRLFLTSLLLACLPATVSAAECERLSEICLDGPSTKMISGHPVQRDCWKYEARYTCLSAAMDTRECDGLRDRGCGQISSACVETSDTGCSYYENKFQCLVTAAQTATVADCGTQTFCLDGNCFDAGYANDTDLAQVVASMEAVREAGMYMDVIGPGRALTSALLPRVGGVDMTIRKERCALSAENGCYRLMANSCLIG